MEGNKVVTVIRFIGSELYCFRVLLLLLLSRFCISNFRKKWRRNNKKRSNSYRTDTASMPYQ